jgi:hypothetical protein
MRNGSRNRSRFSWREKNEKLRRGIVIIKQTLNG